MWRYRQRQAVYSGGFTTASPQKGVMLMMQHFALQYVTYENLFGFSLGMIGVAGLVLAFFSLKRKQPPNPYKVSGSFSNACGMGANRLSGSAATSFYPSCFHLSTEPHRQKGSRIAARLPAAFYWISIFLTSGLISGAFGSSKVSTPFS